MTTGRINQIAILRASQRRPLDDSLEPFRGRLLVLLRTQRYPRRPLRLAVTSFGPLTRSLPAADDVARDRCLYGCCRFRQAPRGAPLVAAAAALTFSSPLDRPSIPFALYGRWRSLRQMR